jgi:hypothetical protein
LKTSHVTRGRLGGNKWADIAPFQLQTWNHFEVELTADGFSVSVNNSAPQSVRKPLLRKICFGGLYVVPHWPMGTQCASDMRVKLDSILIE